MLKHIRRISLLVCAVLLLAAPSAAAQTPDASLVTQSQRSLSHLAAFVKQPAVAPQIRALEGPDSLHVGETGRFSAILNLETASLPLRSRWTFGDGTTHQGMHAPHRFAEPGTYSVDFSATNDHGTATDSLTVTVLDVPAASAQAPKGEGLEAIATRRLER